MQPSAEGGAQAEELDTEEEESGVEELDNRAEEKSEREKQAEERRRGLRSWERSAHDALAQSREGLRWMRKEIDKRRGN